MKIPGARTTALLVANAALAVVAVIAVLLDRIALAVLCAVVLQSLTMLVVLISVRRQGDIVTKIDRQAVAVDHVTRRLDNVEERSITEFRALRNVVTHRP